jgi:lactate dehydrogenase-like 2-hydroxyacid dehydrogenase
MSDKKIVIVTDRIANVALEQSILGDQFEVCYLKSLSESEKDHKLRVAIALIVWHEVIDAQFMSKTPNCGIIVRYGAGFDNVDINAASERNIIVCNTPDYGIDEVSDTTCAYILNAIRQISYYENELISGDDSWGEPSKIQLKRTNQHRLGIIGLGRIGTSVARKMQGFGLEIGFYDPYVPRGIEKSLNLRRFESVADLIKFSTILTFHCPLNGETRGLIDKKFINMLNPMTILVNTARGGLVADLVDLHDGLVNERISFLALDVLPTEPISVNQHPISDWINNPRFENRITLTPHTAYYSEEAYLELRTKAAENVLRFFSGQVTLNRLN